MNIPDEKTLENLAVAACPRLNASEARSIALKIITHIQNLNNHELNEIEGPPPFNFNDDFRPTPADPSYGQLRDALLPFADWGRDWVIESARVYRSTPGRKEQILSLEISGPNLKPFVDATLLIYGCSPEAPPMPASARP